MSDRRPRRPSRAAPTDPERRPATAGRPPLEIHRSARRTRTSQASFRDGQLVVRLPYGLSGDAEERIIEDLVGKVVRRHRVADLGGDAALEARAHRLADRYLDGVRPSSVSWSSRMRHRNGSCSMPEGRIRISDRLAGYPPYVVDFVLVHELAHLRVADHSSAFHALLDRYPWAERARGFLEGVVAGELTAAIPEDEPTASTADAAAGEEGQAAS